jgi:hypothetical protein
MTTTQKLSKAQIARELVKFDITLSPSKVKKTPIAELEAMLANAEAAAASKAEATRAEVAASLTPRTIDVDQGSPDADVKPSNVVKPPRASKGINLAPKPAGQIKTCRAGTKQAELVDALMDGSTLWELEGVCSRNASGGKKNWKADSIRSAMYWDINKVKGYGVRTEMMTPRQAYDAGHEASVEHWLGTQQEHEAIVPVYFLVLPAGMAAPLAHTPAALVAVAANRG